MKIFSLYIIMLFALTGGTGLAALEDHRSNAFAIAVGYSKGQILQKIDYNESYLYLLIADRLGDVRAPAKLAEIAPRLSETERSAIRAKVNAIPDSELHRIYNVPEKYRR